MAPDCVKYLRIHAIKKRPPDPLSNRRTTRQYAQRHSAVLGRRIFAAHLLYAAARFCDIEQTRGVAKVSSNHVCNWHILFRQDVEALCCIEAPKTVAAPETRQPSGVGEKH
jgi:hypothetical protein